MSQPKKGLVVKPYNRSMAMNQTEVNAMWHSLSSAVDEIYSKNESNLSFEVLYRNAYNLVLHKNGNVVYSGIEQKIHGYLTTDCLKLVQVPSDNLLAEISFLWSEHKTVMVMIKDILMYLDRSFVVQQRKLPIYDLSLKLFREVIVYHPQIRERLRNIVYENILLERKYQIIDRSILASILSMFKEISIDGVNVYEEDFEAQFLVITTEFYRQESQEFLQHNTVIDYIKKVDRRLKEEEQRVSHYLMKSTALKLKYFSEVELITAHCKYIIGLEEENSGAIHMMSENKLDDLKELFTILSRVPSTLDELRDALGEHVKRIGQKIIDQYSTHHDPVLFVKEMLEMKDKYEQIITKSFDGDKKSGKRLKEAFDYFLNKGNSCASHLASYLDEYFKSGVKGSNELEIEIMLDRVISLFQHLTDKDLFETYYKQLLAKRLLTGKSISDEAEKAVLTKLKTECGYQYTSKLEGMFKDMSMSQIIMGDFRLSEVFHDCPVELDVQILTTGYWPMQAPQSFPLPPTILTSCDMFTNYYLEKNNGKKLSWIWNLGNADIKAKFPSGRRELNVSTYQMCILMLFNTADSFSLVDLRDHFGCIPEIELRRHILSLCTPKIPLVKKSSRGKGIDNDDVFTLNQEFTSKFKRIKVPLIAAKEISVDSSVGLAAEIPGEVEEARKTAIDASIVRIMKARKQMTHYDLTAEVTRQLSHRFNPTPALIKQRIESLIEREYIERDKIDAKVYTYLA